MTGPTEWYAIVNPLARRGVARHRWRSLAAALRQRGIRIEIAWSEQPGHSEALARQAVIDGCDRILIAGGDGSAHEVVNGVMSVRDRMGVAPLLAVAPLGTGNDLARTLGMPRHIGQLADAIAAERETAYDAGVLVWPEIAGRRYFVNVAGVGFDSYVLERKPERGPARLAYLAGLLRGLLSYRPSELTITTETAVLQQRAFVAFAALGRYCGGGMLVAPRAQCDDGLLDVVSIRHLGLAAAIARLPRLYDGGLLDDPAVAWLRAARIDIRAEPSCPVEADGQIVGRTPVGISIIPAALRVVACGSH